MNPLLYVKLGLACAALLGSAYAGYSFEHSRFMVFKAEVETVAREQEAKVISIQKQQELVSKASKENYEAKLSAIKSYYGGVRQSGSGSMSTIPNATISINGEATNLQLACAYTTQQLVSLQDWLNQQIGIK
jgi:hypothetical protein